MPPAMIDHPAESAAPRPRRRRRWLKRLAGIYLILLLGSAIFQSFVTLLPSPDSALPTVTTPRMTAAGPAEGAPVEIAYRVYDQTGQDNPPTLIAMHGSPTMGRDFEKLGPLLAPHMRVIAPIYPGFTPSTPWVPDYGADAYARYTRALMDRLDIDRAHLLGYSQGGAVAIALTDLAPDRVASVTLYGGVGIQEGEGTGDYHYEQFKYHLGYGAFVVLPELIPHFGLLGPRSFRHAFIRNFIDGDLRPNRQRLEQLDRYAPPIPLLVLHGRHDPLVPAWAAEAHHDLVEPSQRVIFDASHFMVFTDTGPTKLADEIVPFVDQVQRGIAIDRRAVDHSPGPLESESLPIDIGVARDLSPWAQLALVAAAPMISEDLACITAGLLVRAGQLDWTIAILGCLLGIYLGDMATFLVGRFVGRRILKWRFVSTFIRPEHVDRFGAWFDRHLIGAVVGSRFMPGMRVPMYLSAGVVSHRIGAFAFWLGVAVLLWVPMLVGLAMAFGPAVARPFELLLGAGWWS